MPYYIATIYVHLINADPGATSFKMLGPFVKRFDLRVPQDYPYLARQEMERAFQGVMRVEVGPVSLAKNQNSLPLKEKR